MRTASLLSISRRIRIGSLPYLWWAYPVVMQTSQEADPPPGGRPPVSSNACWGEADSSCRQTDAYENITFPLLRIRAVII